jgi:hypothetical protein
MTITADLDKVVKKGRENSPSGLPDDTGLTAVTCCRDPAYGHDTGRPNAQKRFGRLCSSPPHISHFRRFNSRTDRILGMLPKPICPVHYLRYTGLRLLPAPERPLDKEVEARRHAERRRLAPLTDIWMYSDGSMKETRVPDGQLSEGRKNCGRWMEVVALEAVKTAI